MSISKKSKDIIRGYYKAIANYYNGDVGEQYAATPSVAQTLHDAVVEDGSWFLKLINIVPVKEIKGEKVFLGLSGRILSRTEITGGAERIPRDLSDTANKGYELSPVEYNVALKYSVIDAWAKFKDFGLRYSRHILKAIGNDDLTCGWHGTSIAATTDIVANPKLEDANIGWLEQIKLFNGGSQFSLGTGAEPISLGSAKYPNLDVLVLDSFDSLEPPFDDDAEYVALISKDLVVAAQGDYYAINGSDPTKKIVLEQQGRLIKGTYGTLNAITPPFFPGGTILIIPLDNLSIYFQEDSVRRLQKDNPSKNQYEDFLSMNKGYVVEDFNRTILVQGITIE